MNKLWATMPNEFDIIIRERVVHFNKPEKHV